MVKLGQKAKDTVTGFVGIVAGRCEYVGGTGRILLSAHVRNGKRIEEEWFDEARIVPVGGKK